MDVFDDYSYGNITGSAMLSIYKRNNIQYISVSNVDVVNFVTKQTANRFCIDPGNVCTNNLSLPLEAPLGNETFVMDAYFPSGNPIQFFHGIADDEGFFAADGTMYTIDKLCTTQQSNQSNLEDKEVHCCSAFKPVPQAPSNQPRCKKFKSRSSIVNANDNFSIFFTSSMNFTLDGNLFSAVGSISGATGNNYSIEYWYNDYWMCDSAVGPASVQCDNYTFPDGDAKIIFSVEFIRHQHKGESYANGGGMFARLIIRDGQTLMEEGIPFSTKNDCSYQNFKFAGNPKYIVQNQFCCLEFESSFEQMQRQKVHFLKSMKKHSKMPFIEHSNLGQIKNTLIPSRPNKV
uniref:Uncharacterized protein n=1 Tax=Panagrolaimus davidi TaxID=227884 RepID=A0A914QPR7_9BILA